LATQVFADEELERLRGFPEIGRDELARFFTLTPADVAFVGQTAAAVGESWPWVRRCPYEGEIEIRWVVLEPSRVRRAESGTRGLPADADRAPIRFPRRARLYV